MQTITAISPAEWLNAVSPLLYAHEAEHGLMLGLATATAAQHSHVQPGAFWGYVLDGGEVVAAALGVNAEGLILSRGPAAAIQAICAVALDLNRHVLRGPVQSVAAAAEASGRSHRPGFRQGIYELRRVIAPRSASGAARRATDADLGVLVRFSVAYHAEALGHATSEAETERGVRARLDRQQLFVWEDGGQVVAMTGVAGPTRGPGAAGGGLRVNAVYTPPALRGHGYASGLVAHVSRHALDAGYDFMFLYTDLANPTSNAIYQRLGYDWVAESHEAYLEVGATTALT